MLNVNVAEWNPDTGDYSVDLVMTVPTSPRGSVTTSSFVGMRYLDPAKARELLVEALGQLDEHDEQWAATLDRTTTRRTR